MMIYLWDLFVGWSRSTWACELKFFTWHKRNFITSHAPRERVSWNLFACHKSHPFHVTLHVSVWVEIRGLSIRLTICAVTLHVSVWVEITYKCRLNSAVFVTLHVSVWVEMHVHFHVCIKWKCHAPRERVSWNALVQIREYLLFVTLHVSVWVEILCVTCAVQQGGSRSTWACELKFYVLAFYQMPLCHAPRERVSWNCCQNIPELRLIVTLHVSVWVEISSLTSAVRIFQRSRSTWACELKFEISV